MKGVILAGGLGTRLKPLTDVTNKHLLPVYDKPMIYYPINTLKEAGVKNIMIITGPENAGDFMKLLGSGERLGVVLTYRIQDRPTGIAGALLLADDFIKDKEEHFIVLLGDNIFELPLEFNNNYKKMLASIFIKKVNDPKRFGVVTLSKNKVEEIIEKPEKPSSRYIAVGAYIYNKQIFNLIRNYIKPSTRGELEITDINNYIAKTGKLNYYKIKGKWSDAGRIDSLHTASTIIRNTKKGNTLPQNKIRSFQKR